MNVFVWCFVTGSKRDTLGKVVVVDFIPLILQDISDNQDQEFRMSVVFASIPMLNSNCHESNEKHIFNTYKEDITQFLDAQIIPPPLCASIENDLRAQVIAIMDQKRKSFGLSSTVMGEQMSKSDLSNINATTTDSSRSPGTPGSITSNRGVGNMSPIDYTASLSSHNRARQSSRTVTTKMSKKNKLQELDEMTQLARYYGRFLFCDHGDEIQIFMHQLVCLFLTFVIFVFFARVFTGIIT